MAGSYNREYAKLNSEQKKAVDAIDGPVLVIAGPGTGKTQLLSMRVAKILASTDTDANNILCLTFTDAAALNMRERLLKLIGPAAHKVGIYTFHSFGTHIIQSYPEYFYDEPLINPIGQLAEFEIYEDILTNLVHSNPLGKKYGDTFLHIQTITKMISWFKQAGLSPSDLAKIAKSNKQYLDTANKYLVTFDPGRTLAKNIQSYTKLSLNLNKGLFDSQLANSTSSELEEAVSQAEADKTTKPLTAWRRKWLTETKLGRWQFSDTPRNNYLIYLLDIYDQYQSKLTDNGYYTFDDMILRTSKALEVNEELRLTLQEQYQYVLVDEYQDTSWAQNKLLSMLAGNPINENKPNLMVVGDDDQAIYRFQGADSSLMVDFLKRWEDVKIIVLKDSYRSGQQILDLAGSVIKNANDRLEDQSKNIKKMLQSAANYKTDIRQIHANYENDLYVRVSGEIDNLIKSGVPPSTIAVLAPKHVYLQSITSRLLDLGIPVNYERREQILEQPRIVEVTDLIQLAIAVNHLNFSNVNAILPKVLASSYWQLTNEQWWKLALSAQKKTLGWLDAIDTEPTSEFSQAIKAIGKDLPNQSYELTIAQLLGNAPVRINGGIEWYAPWRNYYFSEDQVTKDPESYLRFLRQFNTLSRTFGEWQPRTNSSILEFQKFIDLYRSSKLPLLDNSLFSLSTESVNVMTVYKAKGLEWNTVFLLSCQDDVWGPQTRSRNTTFKLPYNLQWIQPSQENKEDLVRLFYVGLTRAKIQLYITSFTAKDNGKPAEYLSWLEDNSELLPRKAESEPTSPKDQIFESEIRWYDPYTKADDILTQLLKPRLRSYKLSATHLNNFLSIQRGGPQYFLLHDLLRIPDIINTHAIYGDAIHQSLEYIHNQLATLKTFPEIKDIRKFFKEKLSLYPLSPKDFRLLERKGEDNLASWYKQNKESLKPTDISEYNFRREGVTIGDSLLTGKIDVIRFNNTDQLTVIDYKTSSPLLKWSGHNAEQAIKGHTYQRQLYFYKLLIENSARFGKKYIASTGQIDFISPQDDGDDYVSLESDMPDSEVDRLKTLIVKVWQHIQNLQFPDTDNYPKNLKGIKAFEDDLINGVI